MPGMPARVTVVLPSSGPASRVGLDSLDRQSLPAGDVEVVVLDDGSDPARRDRLESLARNRTNVAVADSSTTSGSLAAVVGAASGSHLLLLAEGSSLAPDALERLVLDAAAADADVTLLRTTRRGRRIDAPVPATTRSRLDPALARGLTECARAYRTSFLRDVLAGLPAGTSLGTLDEHALGRTDAVAWCAAAAVLAPAAPDDAPRRWRARATSWSWSERAVVATVRLRPAGGPEPEEWPEVRGVVFRSGTGAEWDVPLTPTGAGGWELTLDPSTAAGGSPLEGGGWTLGLLVRDAGGTQRVPLRAASGRGSACAHDGRPSVLHSDKGRLGLDVGARRHPVAARLRLSTAEVREDARGSLLGADLPDLALAPGEVLEGELVVGDLPVRAWAREADGRARLSAWVSGLPGTYDLALRLSTTAPAPLGARLVVDAAGTMTVTRVPRRRPAPATSAPPPVEAPAPLWRVVARRVPGATTAYRRLAGLVDARR